MRGALEAMRSRTVALPIVRAVPKPVLDAVDLKLIELLQSDGRMSYVRLAEHVGLSEAATRQRVTRLMDGGVIQIVAVADPLSVGMRRAAMVGITVAGDVRPIVDALGALDEVVYLVSTAGSFDLLAEVVVGSDDELMELLNRKVRTIEGVRSTETFVYLRLDKQTFQFGAH
jgi:Lrp/AsnC family transcriptional regulator, regulator for asnA, asnC and gidA